jgi:adenylyltransferase/sulfurtransferase
MIGVMMASEAIKYFTDPEHTIAGKLLSFSTINLQMHQWSFPRDSSKWYMPHTLDEIKNRDYGDSKPGCRSDELTVEAFLELTTRHDDTTLIVDVREPGEQPRISHPSVVNIPLNELKLSSLALVPRIHNIVICATGSRSDQAVKLLRQVHQDYEWKSLQGGLHAMNVQVGMEYIETRDHNTHKINTLQ